MVLAEINFSDSFQRTFDQFGDFLPRLAGAIAIFFVGWLIAKFIRGLVHKALTRAGIDNLVDKSGLGQYIERMGYPDSGLLLAKVVYIGIMLLVLQLTVDALEIVAIKDVLDDIVAFIPKVFVAIIILFLTGAIANFVKDFVRSLSQEQAWGNLVTNIATGAVWVIGVFAALDQIEVAQDIVDTLFQALIGSLALIAIIKFGVGGVWAARDRFWPGVYDKFSAATRDTSAG
ncbi:MAG: mechanosensitive ion channel family protein [Acidimicrobiales bacterium]